MYCRNCGGHMDGDGINTPFRCFRKQEKPSEEHIDAIYDCTAKDICMQAEGSLQSIIDDAIRLGAALGAWHDSKVPWHCRAASTSIRAIREEAIQAIKHDLKSLGIK